MQIERIFSPALVPWLAFFLVKDEKWTSSNGNIDAHLSQALCSGRKSQVIVEVRLLNVDESTYIQLHGFRGKLYGNCEKSENFLDG